ncbi:hypothetical protein K435DRAFT_924069 [Dendrothele bispora CBS 962.96]|uniref:Uncharacterized protein n=1 Tax=Dendrothele bispora (strain CBS 962.96) TaxID=1314807 RepID=A0A4S8LAT5_DENBC|nr:hypothetical protein K435DRAFT_924069 [Dendrothele bispora CBS 962.96]
MDPLTTTAGVAQVIQLATSAATAYHEVASANDQPRVKDDLDLVTEYIDEALNALVRLSRVAQVSPQAARQYGQFHSEFLMLNQQLERTLKYSDLGLCMRIYHRFLRDGKPPSIRSTNKKMKTFKGLVISASAGAELTYRSSYLIAETDLLEELDVKMLQLYAEKNPSMTMDEFIRLVVRRAALRVLPSEKVDGYLVRFNQKLNDLPQNSGDKVGRVDTGKQPEQKNTASVSRPSTTSPRSTISGSDTLTENKCSDLNNIEPDSLKLKNPFKDELEEDLAELLPMLTKRNEANFGYATDNAYEKLSMSSPEHGKCSRSLPESNFGCRTIVQLFVQLYYSIAIVQYPRPAHK